MALTASKLYLESTIRSEMRKDFDKEFGKTIYSFSERENIKIASFPLHNDNLLRVSIEKQEQSHEKIIQSILKIISELTAQDISWTYFCSYIIYSSYTAKNTLPLERRNMQFVNGYQVLLKNVC